MRFLHKQVVYNVFELSFCYIFNSKFFNVVQFFIHLVDFRFAVLELLGFC